MNSTTLSEILMDIATTIREEGEMGKYRFEWKSADKSEEVLNFHFEETSISISYNQVLTKSWHDTGLKYKLFHRYNSEEERFQKSLIEDNVFSTECENALAVAVRNLFAFLRDGIGAYSEELYKNGLD